MFLKEREIPVKLLRLNSMLTRLPYEHPKRELVLSEQAKVSAGFKGEQMADAQLAFLEKERAYVIPDIRLFHEGHYFQMDTVLLFPKFVLILEVKNMAGELTFEPEFGHVVRQKEGAVTIFDDPISQVEDHKWRLERWLNASGYGGMPIETFVISANSGAWLRSGDQMVHEKVVRLRFMEIRIRRLMERYEHLAGDGVPMRRLRQLGNTIIRANDPLDSNVMGYMKIRVDELRSGVQCPACARLGMRWVSGSWNCGSCGAKSKDAHLAAMEDYRLLVGEWITNREFRAWCGVESRKAAEYMLKKAGYRSEGDKKSTRYHLKL